MTFSLHNPVSPPVLGDDDLVQIVAPSGPVNRNSLSSGLQALRYRHYLSDAVFERSGYWAGSISQRQNSFQQAIDDSTSQAVLCARGGFGVTLLLDLLKWEIFLTRPKWIIGNSDITALLVFLWSNFGICTVHGPMAARLAEYPQADIDELHEILKKGFNPHTCFLKALHPGAAEGPLIGGNLTMLAHMMGTLPRHFARGCILFLEDVTEAPYRIERNLVQLKRNGIFEDIKGVVLGEFTQCSPGKDGTTVGEVLKRNLMPPGIPIATDYPAAHGDRNRPFVHGHPVHLQVNSTDAFLTETINL